MHNIFQRICFTIMVRWFYNMDCLCHITSVNLNVFLFCIMNKCRKLWIFQGPECITNFLWCIQPVYHQQVYNIVHLSRVHSQISLQTGMVRYNMCLRLFFFKNRNVLFTSLYFSNLIKDMRFGDGDKKKDKYLLRTWKRHESFWWMDV